MLMEPDFQVKFVSIGIVCLRRGNLLSVGMMSATH